MLVGKYYFHAVAELYYNIKTVEDNFSVKYNIVALMEL